MEHCCSDHEKNCSCPTCGCHAKSTCEEHKGEEFTHSLLEIADSAWMEVLKDKIKEHIVATQNERMTELAKLVSETNNQRWKHKMEKKHGCAEFKEKLCQFFGKFKK